MAATTPTAMPSPADAFDEVFVRPCQPDEDRTDPPALPRGWRHSSLVTRIANQPRERREALFSVIFAVAAALWAPLGVAAFFVGRTGAFFLLTLVLVIAVAAPRPAAPRDATASLREHLRPAMASARALAGGLAARVTVLAAASSKQVRHRTAGLAGRLSDWSAGHRTPRSTR